MIYIILALIILIVFTKALCSLSKEDDDNLTNDEMAEKVENKINSDN